MNSLYHNTKPILNEINNKLHLNKYKQVLSNKYKLRHFTGKELNKTQIGLVQLESFFKKEQHQLTIKKKYIDDYEKCQDKCWDLKKINVQYSLLTNYLSKH